MISNSRRLVSILFTVFSLLTAQNAFAGFPSYSGGGGTCFFGCTTTTSTSSTLSFDFSPDNDGGLAPVAINFFPYPGTPDEGDLCFSGKVEATVSDHVSNYDGIPATGAGTFSILSGNGDNKGMCYSNVTRVATGTPTFVGDCTSQTYEYKLVLPLTDGSYDELNGQFVFDPDLPHSGAFDECVAHPDSNICSLQVGFGFGGNPIPADLTAFFQTLFPSETTLSGASTAAGQVFYADEVVLTCNNSTDVGVDPSAALSAKTTKSSIKLSEALSMNAHWCSNAYSNDPDCTASNPHDPTQLAIGTVNTAIGDYQQQNTTVTCVDSLADLKNLTCSTETAIGTCATSTTGYMQFPADYSSQAAACPGSGNVADDYFAFTAAEGSGYSTVNLAAIGAENAAPGYVGDNTLPPISFGKTAVVSTPDNQPNVWDLSNVMLINVVYIHGRNNDDTITGSTGNDTILGGSGADTLDGGEGNDILQGGDNTDTLIGESGNDLILGYECNSTNATCGSFLNNGSDDDILNGGDGDDCLDGGRGNDTYIGGSGSDAIVLFGNSDIDTVMDYGSDDVIVDLVGGAKVVAGKQNTSGYCEVTTSGNNKVILQGVPKNCNGVTILDVAGGTDSLPAQCTGHPYTYQ